MEPSSPSLRPCCEDETKRTGWNYLGNGLTVSKCSECGAKHYELTIDGLNVAAQGAAI